MQVELFALIGAVVGISGMIIGIMGYVRGSKKIDQDSASAMVGLQVDLKYMKKQLESIGDKLDRLEDTISTDHVELVKVIQKVDNLNKFYNELKERFDEFERRN